MKARVGHRVRGRFREKSGLSQVVRLAGLFVMLALLVLPSTAFARGQAGSGSDDGTRAAPADWAPPTTVYIPDTGHTIDGMFLDLWRSGGGYNSYGYPISPEITEADGHVVQYYDYARFEYWPNGNANGEYVSLGRIGEELRPVTIRRTTPMKATASRIVPIETESLKEQAAAAEAWLPLRGVDESANSASYRYVPETRHSVANGFKDFWERTGEAIFLGNPLTEEYVLAGVTYQVFERGQLAWDGGDPYMVDVGKLLATRYGIPMDPVGQGDIPTYSEDLFIPPPDPTPAMTLEEADPTGERWVDIDLTNQYLRAYQGSGVVMETYISSGRDPDFTTPTGTYFVNSKIPSQTMEGVLGGEYYNVPDVPHVMYFTDVGHAIHGTYWHANFGTPMSHGCINVPMDVSGWLYDWAPMGMRVVIHY